MRRANGIKSNLYSIIINKNNQGLACGPKMAQFFIWNEVTTSRNVFLSLSATCFVSSDLTGIPMTIRMSVVTL